MEADLWLHPHAFCAICPSARLCSSCAVVFSLHWRIESRDHCAGCHRQRLERVCRVTTHEAAAPLWLSLPVHCSEQHDTTGEIESRACSRSETAETEGINLSRDSHEAASTVARREIGLRCRVQVPVRHGRIVRVRLRLGLGLVEPIPRSCLESRLAHHGAHSSTHRGHGETRRRVDASRRDMQTDQRR